MGPKSAKGALQKKNKKNDNINLDLIEKLKKLLKEYEKQCSLKNSSVDTDLKDALKKHMSESTELCKFVLQGRNDKSLPPNKISPLLKALRVNWYKMIKHLYLWEMDIPREEICDLNEFFEQPCYAVEYLELLNCKIDSYSLQELSKCFATNHSLTALVLDFTNLQFDGLVALCSGLKFTKSIVKLSLCYCKLTSSCGQVLGKAVSECTISELYLDGNCFECFGLIGIIQLTVHRAEEEQLKLEAYQEHISLGQKHTEPETASSTRELKSSTSKSAKGKKKKKKKKVSAIKATPKCGPYLSILHIADNGIDGVSISGHGNLMLEATGLISRWISTSPDLTEFDLEGNLIGEFGGREIHHALQKREEAGLKPLYIKVTHRLSEEVFQNIISLGSGSSKRGGKKKKKKGKSGKSKV